MDPSGLLQVTKGEAVVETTEEYTVKVMLAWNWYALATIDL